MLQPVAVEPEIPAGDEPHDRKECGNEPRISPVQAIAVEGHGPTVARRASAKSHLLPPRLRVARSRMVTRLRTPWIFTLGAGIYELLTARGRWRQHCRQMAACVPGRRLLDLGIGPGVSGIEMSRAAPHATLVGIDSSAAMIRRAKRHTAEAHAPVILVRADAGRLPFADGSFDGVAGHSFLYLLLDSDAALREARRVVRPGGTVAFLEPNGDPKLGRGRALRRAFRDGIRFGASMLLWSMFSRLHGRYTPTSLAAQLERCGFVEPRVSRTLNGLGLLATATRAQSP